jgi:hypothetical protein
MRPRVSLLAVRTLVAFFLLDFDPTGRRACKPSKSLGPETKRSSIEVALHTTFTFCESALPRWKFRVAGAANDKEIRDIGPSGAVSALVAPGLGSRNAQVVRQDVKGNVRLVRPGSLRSKGPGAEAEIWIDEWPRCRADRKRGAVDHPRPSGVEPTGPLEALRIGKEKDVHTSWAVPSNLVKRKPPKGSL